MDRGRRVRGAQDEAVIAFDRVIGLDLKNVALDGSLHKAPHGGEGTGPKPVRQSEIRLWSVAVDGHGIPIGWTIDGAGRNEVHLLEPTLDAVAAGGFVTEIGTPCISIAARLRRRTPTTHRGRDPRLRHPTARYQDTRVKKQPARAQLDRGSHQHRVVELRPTPPQHRPPNPARELRLATTILILAGYSPTETDGAQGSGQSARLLTLNNRSP